MNDKVYRVMLVGHFETGRLEWSYKSAFEALGCEVLSFDIVVAVERYVRLGLVGRLLNTFLSVEPWIQKAHRELALKAMNLKPDLVVTFGQYPLRVGSLALIRASTDASLVHIWPDPLFNWNTHLTACIPMYDCIATYSKATVSIFQELGAKCALWIPLAGDPSLHPVVTCTEPEKQEFSADVTFAGRWRPERETVLSQLSNFDLKIWGPDWGRRCKSNRAIMRAWQGRPIYGSEFAKAIASSKISLNIIDPTNYPAANMRFFEIPVAGGLQISSPCPEMDGEFRHGEHVFYYKQVDELPGLIRHLLADDKLRNQVATSAYQKALADHTYTHRARRIVQLYERHPRKGGA
jgi:spore maturation protein CgeB